MFDRLITFLKEAKIELKKVAWPTRQETVRYTAMVIVISAALAMFLGIADFGFRTLLDKFIL